MRARSGQKVVAGNWKMNLGPLAARRFVEELDARLDAEGVRLILFPPAISFRDAEAALPAGSAIELGVQNIHWEPSGALTGELSAEMAAEAGAAYALVGHSERRHIFGETDSETARKVEAAYRAGLEPVLCLGETLEERRAGRLEEVVYRQLDAVLDSDAGRALTNDRESARIMLAYEPVWAIGTGQTATPEDAADAHGLLRRRLAEAAGEEAARSTPILYGGSVKPDNAAELMAASDVDGVLVGGASLKPESFARIALAAG